MDQQTLTTQTRPADGAKQNRTAGDRSQPVERDETNSLISSDKVDGTTVYATDGEKIGHIAHLMIGKRSGKVEYAVMNFGSFLGMGGSHHPLPWDALAYDTDRGGYTVAIDKDKLRGGPSYKDGAQPSYDRQYGQSVYGYYGLVY